MLTKLDLYATKSYYSVQNQLESKLAAHKQRVDSRILWQMGEFPVLFLIGGPVKACKWPLWDALEEDIKG